MPTAVQSHNIRSVHAAAASPAKMIRYASLLHYIEYGTYFDNSDPNQHTRRDIYLASAVNCEAHGNFT